MLVPLRPGDDDHELNDTQDLPKGPSKPNKSQLLCSLAVDARRLVLRLALPVCRLSSGHLNRPENLRPSLLDLAFRSDELFGYTDHFHLRNAHLHPGPKRIAPNKSESHCCSYFGCFGFGWPQCHNHIALVNVL